MRAAGFIGWSVWFGACATSPIAQDFGAFDAGMLVDAGVPDVDGSRDAGDLSLSAIGDAVAGDAGDAGDATMGIASADAAVSTDAGGSPLDAGIDAGNAWPSVPDAGLANYVFLTSTRYTGNLGGLAGADAICQRHADIAQLPGTYRAWLSISSGETPLTRFGQARGFRRVDERPFADSLEGITSRVEIFYPLLKTELGVDVVESFVWTGTTAAGSAASATCDGWTKADAAARGQVGFSHNVGQGWTNAGDASCDGLRPLYCFAVDRTTRLVPSSFAGARRAFLSKGVVAANSGIAAADQRCASDAAEQHLVGRYKALLAVEGSRAAARFDLQGPPWARLDGTQLADTAAGFVALETARAGLNLTSDGLYMTNAKVWTGAAKPDALGVLTTTCASWSSATDALHGQYGTADALGAWFGQSNASCGALPLRVYCLQE